MGQKDRDRVADIYYSDFETIFTSNIPLIDLRAPIEFEDGSIPGAINLPLLSNSERHDVGLCYKEKGQEEAIILGNEIVSGEIKEERLEKWISFIEENPETVLYCKGGGLRSQTVQAWLKELGTDVPIITGGYKAVRRYLMEITDTLSPKKDLLVLSGNTGSLKTDILIKLSKTHPVIDLEGLANHKGSAFGYNLTPQPSQVDFENRLAKELLLLKDEARPIVIEDESKSIGRVALPNSFYEKKKISPVFLLNIPLSERVINTRKIYVENLWKSDFSKSRDFETFKELYSGPLNRIKKKLGGENLASCLQFLDEAIKIQQEDNSFEAHEKWIEILLANYYDPLYEKGMKNKNIVGSGSVKEFLASLI